MNLFRKRDIVLAAGLLTGAAAIFGYQKLTVSKTAVTAGIYTDGRLVETLDLSVDRELTVPGVNGGYNRLIVKGGEIWCDEASCPDKICVHQGKKRYEGDTIICQPNRMSVTITEK